MRHRANTGMFKCLEADQKTVCDCSFLGRFLENTMNPFDFVNTKRSLGPFMT